jgi:DNA (cytosine-5)-methyltransferase 1
VWRVIVVDNFAGGGGASAGIEAALGRPIDYAINHDPEAIAMHRANHPRTSHLCESVWAVNPERLARGREVGLGWFSPDCTFHSKARGGKPFRDRDVARRRRGLAWLVTRWAKTRAAPQVIMLENVEEFADWGPLLPDGKVCPIRRGQTFRRWHREIENLGYAIDMRELRACDYGAPTTRKRLFVIMRRDGGEIVFPEATHGHGRQPYRAAAECIDWSIPCPSIFTRPRPLAETTMRRIARGVMRYVINDPQPFIVNLTHHGGDRCESITEPFKTITAANRGEKALIVPTLVNTRNGEREGQAPRVRATLARPIPTITTRDHRALVTAFLIKYFGADQDPRLDEPLHTITTKDRFGLVMVHGEPHYISDIGMRMLTPRELYLAQGFRPDYVIDHGIGEDGEVIPLTKTAQVRMCGNSVSPCQSEALVRANVVEQQKERAA